MGRSREYAALVCINSCLRLERIRRYLPHFGLLCQRDRRFHLLVAVDGREAEYLEFGSRWGVPMVYSDRREGVGISKNRALQRFPEFDYYFFLDDDVELADESVFSRLVALSEASGIPHFSLFDPQRLRGKTGESTVEGGRILHGSYGGGQFSFFTGTGLRTVGGWHPAFARFRRWGHTEHSHRFVHAGLAPAPFNVPVQLCSGLIWHYPPSVTRRTDVEITPNEIPSFEQELIDQRLGHVAVETAAPHHFNGEEFHDLGEMAGRVAAGERYPLVDGRERRRCHSDWLTWRAQHAGNPLSRTFLLVAAAALWPASPMVHHLVKTMLPRFLRRRGPSG